MEYIADFHIHSHFSRATSKQLTPEYLDYWAKIKGITLIGTGDFTHPGWLAELKEKLEPAENGLFRLKKDYQIKTTNLIPQNQSVRFLLTAEISNIYKKNEKVRKIHNVIFAPDFETVENIQHKLQQNQFNITSDGRPILGLDARNLLELLLEINEQIYFVPAHIWTPWFSMLGEKSGFNSIEECFEDLSSHIHTIETGLSSDPPMNWLCSQLDKVTLISNSDAHSPDKLGRNANMFSTELSYPAVISALKAGNSDEFLGTIELFPQEGKYHYDGHRKCGICWDPLQTLKNNQICPICGKKVVIGVLNRVMEIADRSDPLERPNRIPFQYIIPLKEILAEIYGVGEKSKKVAAHYESLIAGLGSELDILLNKSLEQIQQLGGEQLSTAVRRMRNKQVILQPGYDGEYGRITLFKENEDKNNQYQDSLFSDLIEQPVDNPESLPLFHFNLAEYRLLKAENNEKQQDQDRNEQKNHSTELNEEQTKAVQYIDGPSLILAGPGTGKTRTLVDKVFYLIKEKEVPAEKILAVTFTNKASLEMEERVKKYLNLEQLPSIHTFHSLGYQILKKEWKKINRRENWSIINENQRIDQLKDLNLSKKWLTIALQGICKVKQYIKTAQDLADEKARVIFQYYQKQLQKINAFDLDDLLYQTITLLKENADLLQYYQEKFQWILVDEYQDINYAQYQLIKLLSKKENHRLCVIGDPNQAIYSFRGSDIRFINQFITDYPGAKIFQLKTSYRCTNKILSASSNILNLQKDQILSGLEEGVKIKIIPCQTDKSEAEYIARQIEKLVGGMSFFTFDSNISSGHDTVQLTSLNQCAILCRLKNQMSTIKKALIDHHIPCQIIGDTSIFQNEPALSVINTLQLYTNPENPLLLQYFHTNNNYPVAKELLESFKNNVDLTAMIKESFNQFNNNPSQNDQVVCESLLYLANHCNNDLNRFIQYTDLASGVDTPDTQSEKIKIMTIHAAKGLEFDCVFVAGCEEGLLPYTLFDKEQNKRAEEKRLLYVAMTRAKNELYLTHAQKRTLFNRTLHLNRSTFLDQIEKDLKEEQAKQELKKNDQPLLF
ncbi:MAG: UvrD-helicase domain-containing protein [Spirochaetes bacterium]|nr:UvrD-helicase domain-containing protein [Spirochaetota bacterium]